MSVVVDFYLRDQIIRGELPTNQGRPLDILNNRLENFLILENAMSKSLHMAAEPFRLGQTRLHKEHLLLAVPRDEPRNLAAPIRGGWVEKRFARVAVGLGPLVVSGNLHFGQWESVTPDAIGRNADGRAFLPATEARIRSLYLPDWAVEAPSALLARGAMGYISLMSAPSDDPQDSARVLDELYRSARPSVGVRH
jgi:hypothetical protein